MSPSADVMELERQYLFQNYARYPVVMHRGKGCYMYSAGGLGHAHPRIVKLIREQAGLLVHTSNLYYNEYQGPLAERLAKISGLQRSFFCNSGTEAMEGAIKMMHAHGRGISQEKFEIVSLDNSFHGRSTGALALTGQPKYRADFEPLLPGVRFTPANDIAALEQVVSEKTAGIVLEVIQGEGGINLMSEDYVRRARELAEQYNALLVLDEIQCGVGRPGVHFAYQLFDPCILPDVLLAAKPMSCGLPLGVIIANEKAAATIKPGMHGTTFGGGPLTCRVALEFFDILEELLPSITRVGDYFRDRLRQLGKTFAFIKDVRGRGLMVGAELDIPGKQIVLDCMEAGVLLNCTHDTVLRYLPPYIVTERQVDEAIKVLAKVLKKY
ncbi:MAG: aminotransferase class III-fold pyridoxal phosphate-dependent enzyme [Acidobacteria bacterium]|nr:aminotransferase class III-fold pyridoxal phosphate-dependent enzyme [Acidobacteriota bacterium]